MRRKHNIKVEGHIGTWYVIDEFQSPIGRLYILEHEDYGDEACCICVDGATRIILEDVANGRNDVIEYLESRGIM